MTCRGWMHHTYVRRCGKWNLQQQQSRVVHEDFDIHTKRSLSLYETVLKIEFIFQHVIVLLRPQLIVESPYIRVLVSAYL